MPWLEMSQKDFLEYVVPVQVLTEDDLLRSVRGIKFEQFLESA